MARRYTRRSAGRSYSRRGSRSYPARRRTARSSGRKRSSGQVVRIQIEHVPQGSVSRVPQIAKPGPAKAKY